ncbi:MAG: alkene reductase [Chlorobiaceae bacterium]|nr:alkene reductase [Chlorobiaceae bacterium]NTV61777.1 alkene reductase [Chlorobiaceae bacterium]
MPLLFSPVSIGSMNFQNRVVMAPMTRSRATADNLPNTLMAEYYAQRATAGLIVTEGTSPSPNGLGYPRIPGIFSLAQVIAWKPVTEEVHRKGAKIFMQLMHCGRVGHPLNLPPGARLLGPSAVAAAGEIYTDKGGLQPFPVPEAMTLEDIRTTMAEFATAATSAVAAGFDGVELHAANGYLIEQFIRPNSNLRSDGYGGIIENRSRFLFEVLEALIGAIGRERVGIRLSPFGVFNDMPLYKEMEDEYIWLAGQLDAAAPSYVHLVDHSAMGAPAVPDSIRKSFRRAFTGILILSGGYDALRAEKDLVAEHCDLVAFGRPFIANPDLLKRWQSGMPLNEPDMTTFYTPGPKGYTDYPFLKEGNG